MHFVIIKLLIARKTKEVGSVRTFSPLRTRNDLKKPLNEIASGMKK